jgi:atypical dual specificity phosphatase
MSQITDEIWLGSYAEACDEQFLKDRTINHILCCAEEFAVRAGFPYSDQRTGYKVSLKDDFADEKTMELFLDGAAKLNDWISSGNRTMVHCFAGISRSVSVVITYFMIYKGWSFNTAFNHLKHCRHKSNPHHNYIPILLMIESKRSLLNPRSLA